MTERKQSYPNVTMTQSITSASTGLARLHAAAKRDSQLRFNNLMHLITEAMLDKAYKALNRKAAKGVDGEDWQSYGVPYLEVATTLS